METPQKKNIVIIGGGIIGSSTAYYLTRHPKFNPSLHTITLLEASSIAAGASGKSGGLLGLWAYPECLVPLSYRLHRELAEEHGGDQKWGYRHVKCGTIGAVVKKKKHSGLVKAATENAVEKAQVAQPGLSSLQTGKTETASPKPHPQPNIAQTKEEEAPAPEPKPVATLPLVTQPVATIPAPAPQPTLLTQVQANSHTSGTAPKFTTAAFAPIPELLTPTPEPPIIPSIPSIPSTNLTLANGEANAQNGVWDTAQTKPETIEKDWEKLPKQNAAATSLLGQSHLPPDLDWIDPEYVQSYEEMGREGFSETAQVHPFHFTTAVAELARSAGVDIRTGAKVTKFIPNTVSPGLNTVEYVDRNSCDEVNFVEATDVIVTAGPWTGKLLPRSKVEGLRAHSVVYKADLSPYAVFTDIQLPGDYVPEHRARAGQKRKHKGNVDPEVYARPFGEVYACGEPDKNIPLPDTADQVQVDEGQCDDLTAYLGTISPILAAAPVKAKQACYIPQHVRFGTERGALIGPTSLPGIWIAAGHTCWGVQNAPGTGLLMAEWIFDGEAKSADIDVLHPAKFKV